MPPHAVPTAGTLNEISYCAICGAGFNDTGPCPVHTMTPGMAVEVRSPVHGNGPGVPPTYAWLGGYSFDSYENLNDVLVKHTNGSFRGLLVRYKTWTVRPKMQPGDLVFVAGVFGPTDQHIYALPATVIAAVDIPGSAYRYRYRVRLDDGEQRFVHIDNVRPRRS